MRTRRGAAIGSAAFFLAAPTLVAGAIPWLLTEYRAGAAFPPRPVPALLGGLLLTAGLAVLVDTFARFVREGRGTPAPIAPTEWLVAGGAYRYVRNPMYLAVIAVITGQSLVLARPVLLAYAAVVWALVAAFTHWYEQPTLRRRFGQAYESYLREVPAWLPRRPERGDVR
jgi:protein-S-isoprenylcysteine O-methyltransferase Ste14